jgi:hypothetical protein
VVVVCVQEEEWSWVGSTEQTTGEEVSGANKAAAPPSLAKLGDLSN